MKKLHRMVRSSKKRKTKGSERRSYLIEWEARQDERSSPMPPVEMMRPGESRFGRDTS